MNRVQLAIAGQFPLSGNVKRYVVDCSFCSDHDSSPSAVAGSRCIKAKCTAPDTIKQHSPIQLKLQASELPGSMALCGRDERHQNAFQPKRDKYSGQTSRQGKQQTLCQQLPYDAGPRRAHRKSHGDLTMPCGCPGQQQIRHIGASYEKH